ncbi:hypothetical protein B566_EDAN017439 [Ephemera danica]|nr:hypothetical protein B566_EDAN017439 [Ephemera danica]
MWTFKSRLSFISSCIKRASWYTSWYSGSSIRHTSTMRNILNVAEKNDAAKNIALIMSNGRSRMREGLSRFNKIYEFEHTFQGQKCNMTMTSVSGHLLQREFVAAYKYWNSCNPVSLFEAPVVKSCQEGQLGIKVANLLLAKFSQITATAIHQAMARLVQPDENVSNAVEVRGELDLRIGAAFTRFQTLRLQSIFPAALANETISYGSFTHTIDEVTVQFRWSEDHLFDQIAVQVIFDKCEENPTATVEKVESRPKSKWRPLPLDTVELEKLASRKLRITAAEAMRVAENLYSSGLISYPRTETNIFPKDLALAPLVEMQVNDPNWGDFAQRVLEDGPNPRQGKKSDQAHPPIHPTKYANNLNGTAQRLYELVVRHFLACCSKDAKGQETKVQLDIADEKFHASGLMVLERNYLDVYIYEKWSDSEIHLYEVGEQFMPTTLEIKQGETSPPSLLTEADLIALMEKHGIGTDATHAEHIEKIKHRNYVALHDNQYFVPCQLGIGLAEGYDNMGFNMVKPYLRAELESDLKKICEGMKNPQAVLQDQIRKYKALFVEANQQAQKIDVAVEKYLEEQRQPYVEAAIPDNIMQKVRPCPSCGQDMVLKQKRNAEGYFVSCLSYPACRTAHWFPAAVKEVVISDESCHRCGPETKKLRFKFQRGVYDIYYPEPYHTACIAGCDQEFLTNIGITTNVAPPNRDNPVVGNQGAGIGNRGGVNRGGFNGNQGGNRGGGARDNGRGAPGGRGNWSSHSDSGYDSMGSMGTQSEDRGRGNNWRGNLNKENTGGGGIQRARPVDPPPAARPASQPDNQEDGPPYCQNLTKSFYFVSGRQFYVCNKPSGQGCGFFLWADEGAAGAQPAPAQAWGNGANQWNNNDQRGGYRGRGGGGGGPAVARGAGRGGRGAKRKCGNCGNEGSQIYETFNYSALLLA